MLEKIRAMIAEQLGIDVNEVKAESNLGNDLNADSVKDIVEYLEAKGVE